MDKAVAGKFIDKLGLTQEQIAKYESHFFNDIMPVIKRHYLSHLVTTIEEMINEKQKQAFLEDMREEVANGGVDVDYAWLERTVNLKRLRLFSIILVPVESGKLKARTHLIKGDTGALITYWKDLSAEQIRVLIAHELGHIASKYLLNDADSANDSLATLFGYIALQDRNDFYRDLAKQFTHESAMQTYNDIENLCNRKDM
ncbi:MAG: hypothetical protein FWD94_05575 [Treponema sp.]|nr:hypothetical protein [Treponema sp.]